MTDLPCIEIDSVVTHRRTGLTLKVSRFIIGRGVRRLVADEVTGYGLEDDVAGFVLAEDGEREEFEQWELRRDAYNLWKRAAGGGGAVNPVMEDLTLRAAAQYAQLLGDRAAERRIDGVLEQREARR